MRRKVKAKRFTAKVAKRFKVKSPAPFPYVIVRTQSAGVHMGEFREQLGQQVKLANARRLWRWRGANTLNEVALKGVVTSEYTRISDAVQEILLLNAIEIIPCTDAAQSALDKSVWNA